MIIKLSMICSKQENGAYFAICPEVKGCFTQGDNFDEAFSNLKELVEITLKEEMSNDEIQDISTRRNRIYSEFEVSF